MDKNNQQDKKYDLLWGRMKFIKDELIKLRREKDKLFSNLDKPQEGIMTWDKYFINPSDKYTFEELRAIKRGFNEQFNILYRNKAKDFRIRAGRTENNSIIVYVRVPSEAVNGMTYDNLIEFYPIDKNQQKWKDATVKDYGIKFWANTPSFVFNYAFVYNRRGLLIERYLDKYNTGLPKDQALDITNPKMIVGYEKYLYFACKYIEVKGLLETKKLVNLANGLSANYFNKDIRTPDEILAENKKKRVLQKKKKESKPDNKAERIHQAIKREKKELDNTITSRSNITSVRKSVRKVNHIKKKTGKSHYIKKK